MALLILVPAPRDVAAQEVDGEARAIAESVLEAMGGRDAWNATRYVSWNFFGRGRQHYWDKWTGDVRIESPAGENRDGSARPATLTLMNINTHAGRAWRGGEEITGAELDEMLDSGWAAWVNDSYWMFMPYKLLDPGVNLTYVGEDIMADDREADVLQMTFESVGVTPNNRYLVYVARDSGLVEQWSYFANRDDAEPGFTRPWTGWQRFGQILLSTDRGNGADWNIAVHDELPAALFTDPDFSME
jgi:hypothetical protein